MIPTPTGLILAVLGIWCQFGAVRRTLVVVMLLTVLEASNAANLPALGGASITPAKMFMLFVALRVASMRGGLASALDEVSPRRVLFIFLLLMIWAVPSAFLMPRLFQGTVEVFSLERGVIDDGIVPLKPSSGNITQTFNGLGGFVLTVFVSMLARRPGSYEALLKGLLAVSGVDVAFAIVDLVTAATHTGFILDVVHTANYAFLTDDETAGLKRISGSFSEASAFAAYSLALLAVNLALFVQRVRTRLTGFYSVLLTIFLLLSTSSTAYVGLAIYGLAFAVIAAWSLGVHGNARPLKVLVFLGLTGTFLVCVVVLLAPNIAAAAWHVIDLSVLQKSQSDSALERGSFNIQAGKVFFETYGLGVGVGGTRTSNYGYLIASNLGIVGIVLFVGFIAALVSRRRRDDLDDLGAKFVVAARLGVLAALVPAFLIGTIFDLGPLIYVLMGIAASGASAFGAIRSSPVRLAPTRA